MHRDTALLCFVSIVLFFLNHISASAVPSHLSDQDIRSTTPIPPPPVPTVLHINISSVNITWLYTTTTPPTQFIVQILSSSYNDTKFHNLTNPISETHYVYTGLGYSIFYQFRVVAYREGVLSEPSEPSSIFDNGMTAPPGPPTHLHVDHLASDSVMLTWSQPFPANELKYLYHIYKGTHKDQLQLVDSVQESTYYNFKHLQAFTKYYFSVQADYGGEKSILATPVTSSFSDPSLLPPVTITSLTSNYTTITVHWSKPSLTQDALHVETFIISYTPLHAIHPPLTNLTLEYSKNVSGLQYYTILTNLDQYTFYAVAVTYNFSSVDSTTSYTSNSSSIRTVTTLSSLTCLSCHSMGPTQVSLSWQVLNSHNDVLTYVVSADPRIGSRNFTTTGSEGLFDVTGLEPWTEYDFRIFLEGSYSNQSSHCPLADCRTKEAKPTGYPTMVLATPINTTAINVTWMPIPLEEQNGIIVMYLVGCPLCPLTQYSTSELYYVVNGLRPNSNYWFVLAAKNGEGFGPDSTPVSATTIGKRLTKPPSNVLVQYTACHYVTLSWQPPSTSASVGPITMYTVSYTNTTAPTISRTSTISINTTSNYATLTNLSSNSTYTVWVLAWTASGRGPYSSPLTFHTECVRNDSYCYSTSSYCTLNTTIYMDDSSRKCFAITVNWSLYDSTDNVRILYYNVTFLSLRGGVAFTERLNDINSTSLWITSDSIDSNTNYVVVVQVHLMLGDSKFCLQSNSTMKTPSCTGVTTVVAVVSSSVCIVLVLILLGVTLLIFQKCGCFAKQSSHSSAYSPSRMSRRPVVNNDYLRLMNQQRGDGRSTVTGSLSTGSPGVASTDSSLLEDRLGSEADQDLLLPSQESPVLFAPLFSRGPLPPSSSCSTASSGRFEDEYIEQAADGYIPNDLLIKGAIPERPIPEGSSLSSVSLDLSDNY